jgi:tRNA(fMet)-specific endonuclease VapC
VLIEICDKKSQKGEEALNKIIESNENITITAINLHEILYGLQKYAKLAAELELKMEKTGTTIRRTDAMIAATTINNNTSLYTLDLKHFKPLEKLGLKLFP